MNKQLSTSLCPQNARSILSPHFSTLPFIPHPQNKGSWLLPSHEPHCLWFVWCLTRGRGQLMGKRAQKRQLEREGEEEYINWRSWSCLHEDTRVHGMKAKVRRGSLLLTTICLCFFQVENSNSWFRGVRTCAHPWTSSPMGPGCKLYAVGINLSATRSRSLCPCFWFWLRQ